MRLFVLLFWLAISAGRLCGQTRPEVSLPLNQWRLTSGFGYRVHPITGSLRLHCGIDLAARYDPVFAILDGKVLETKYDPALGLFLRVGHKGRLESIYGHLSWVQVWPGQFVRAGQEIAISGQTGKVTGPHLHFALRCGGRWADPLLFFHAWLRHLSLFLPLAPIN